MSSDCLDAAAQEAVRLRTLDLARANDALKEEVETRRQIQAELIQQTDILDSILRQMAEAVIVVDLKQKFLAFNPAAERMFGSHAKMIPIEDWPQKLGLYLPDRTTPFPPDEFPLARLIRGEAINDGEMFIRPDGVLVGTCVRITGGTLRDARGAPEGGIIACHDITALKCEEVFRAGQSRVLEMIAADRPLADVLNALVLLMEAQAEGLRCSILLLSRDGKHVQHGAAPHLPAAYVEAINGAPIGPHHGSCGTAMFTRQPVVVQDVLTDPLWINYRELARASDLSACWSSPILSPQGQVLGSFAMYRNEKRGPLPEETRLTEIATHLAGIAIERKRQQEILRERDARISLAADAVDLAHWVLYPDGSPGWMSEKGCALYELEPERPMTCTSILARIHPDDRESAKAAYDEGCAALGSFATEHRVLLAYGKTRWVIMRGRCLQDEHGHLLETIGITLDITPQKQAALDSQVQREEMAHRNRVSLMGEMTASFAHELNQPLAAIANNASAARRFLERGIMNPELLEELLQDLIVSSQRAGEIVRGIRRLVRKETTASVPMNLNFVIGDTLRLISPDVLARESIVTTELDPQLPQVEAAIVPMQQVMLNLIMNALEAMEGLPAAARRVVVSTCVSHDGVVKAEVRDFGIGLPSDRPEKIFDHFFTTKAEGMGMGLVIVRSILETYGGTITAANAPGGGARVTVCLPAGRLVQRGIAA